MVQESLKEALQKLTSIQKYHKDEHLDEVVLLVQIALNSASKSFSPMSDDQARELYRKLPQGWKPIDFVKAVEKFHSIKKS